MGDILSFGEGATGESGATFQKAAD